MGSQFRTAVGGFGAIAVCLIMASLKSHFLLFGFALASIFLGYWSWQQQSGKRRRTVEDMQLSYTRKVRNRRGENVLTFPQAGWSVSGVTEASGS